MRDENTAYAPSDIELLMRVRGGDTEAISALIERHREAVQTLPDRPDSAALVASARALVTRIRRGENVEIPFRAAWLAQHAHGSLPEDPGSDDVVWTAFVSLPVAWRIALWHREVEGQSARQIAGFLGMTELEAMRALASSYAAMKRYVALAHSSTGESAACQAWVHTYRVAPPSVLDKAHVRGLREHGRRCDNCMGLVRDLFVVENTLRNTLVEVVLGPVLADGYLAGRPVAPRLRQVGAAASRFEGSGNRLRPVIAATPVAAMAIAALVLVLAHPTPFSGPENVLGATRSPSQIAPGVTLEQASSRALGDPGGMLPTSGVVPVGTGGTNGPRGTDATDATDGTGEPQAGPGATGGTPAPTTDPTPVDAPDPTDEPTPPPSEVRPPVSVEVDREDVTVAIDAGVPTGPVVVTVPLPVALPVPIPPPPVPVLPGSAAGTLLGSGG